MLEKVFLNPCSGIADRPEGHRWTVTENHRRDNRTVVLVPDIEFDSVEEAIDHYAPFMEEECDHGFRLVPSIVDGVTHEPNFVVTDQPNHCSFCRMNRG